MNDDHEPDPKPADHWPVTLDEQWCHDIRESMELHS